MRFRDTILEPYDMRGNMKSWDKRKRMKELVKEQKGKCFYCKHPVTEEERTLDHKLAIANGGSNTRKNLVMACRTCNQNKGSMSAKEFETYRLNQL